MGSKRVKSIVVNGHVPKPVTDAAGLREAITQYSKLTLANPGIRDFMTYGTSAGVAYYNELGILPTQNFRKGFFKKANRITAEAINRSILVRREGCTGCAIRCRPIVKIGTQEFEGPEYETLAGFGSLCLVDDLEIIALAHRKSNLYGLDVISTGVLIAYLMEASEHKLLPKAERITWGDGKGLLRLIDRIAYRKGIGDFFAQGLETVSSELGGKEFAVHIKGVEVPLHDPRGKKGLAISYATSPRGATHLEAIHDEMFGGPGAPTADIGVMSPLDRLSWKGKPAACKIYEDLYSFVNSAIICGFVSWNQSSSPEHYPFRHIRSVLNAITGLEIDSAEMLLIGERNYLLRRLLTALDGHTRDKDTLPQRLKEPLQNGICQGERIVDKSLNKAIDTYYELRGMDRYGPTDTKLEQIGLSDLKGLIQRQEPGKRARDQREPCQDRE
jgi:aldehyde:ferredoxin oxidoreductase